jgi:hypothetical protein
MNVALIILIIVILVLVLYLVYYVGFSTQVLYDLNPNSTSYPSEIANKDIVNPNSTSFTYSTWVYVNNWSSGEKTICISKEDSAVKFRLYLDSTSPTLYAEISTTAQTDPKKRVSITNNFPVQRWVYIVISVEGSVVDCYLDGKLIKSQQLQYLPDMSGKYTIGYGKFDAFLTKFQRIASPTDPQTVWNNYMAGNGFANNNSPAYGFSFVVTKDQSPIAKYQYK